MPGEAAGPDLAPRPAAPRHEYPGIPDRELVTVAVDDLPVFRVAQVAEDRGADVLADELDVAVAEHRVHAARMAAEEFIIRPAVVGRPRAFGAAAGRRCVLVDVRAGLA